MAFAILLVGASCSDDDNTPSYSTGVVQNTELKTILVQRGYTFNEDGNLLLDDLAKNTTTLDLSGTQISTDALAELSMFPNLTDVDLSDNGYGPAFDFAKLPEQITGVDLTGNEIYDYDNLINVEIAENGDETISNLHTITKLYMPEVAKYNTTQLPRFYRQNKDAIMNGIMDVQMLNEQNSLQTYNTLRTIPNVALNDYFKDKFSSIFDGEQIDLSKRLNNTEKINNINIAKRFVDDIDAFTDFEGLQYIVENPYWEGTAVQISLNKEQELPKLNIGSTVTQLSLTKVRLSQGIELSGIKDLYQIILSEVSGLESLDLTASPIFGQRDAETEDGMMLGSYLSVIDCSDMKTIKFPEVNELRAFTIDIEYLPNLEALDLSKFTFIALLSIGDLGDNCILEYPTDFSETTTAYPTKHFACSTKTYALDNTKAFIDKYYTNATNKIIRRGTLSCSKNENVYWDLINE